MKQHTSSARATHEREQMRLLCTSYSRKLDNLNDEIEKTRSAHLKREAYLLNQIEQLKLGYRKKIDNILGISETRSVQSFPSTKVAGHDTLCTSDLQASYEALGVPLELRTIHSSLSEDCKGQDDKESTSDTQYGNTSERANVSESHSKKKISSLTQVSSPIEELLKWCPLMAASSSHVSKLGHGDLHSDRKTDQETVTAISRETLLDRWFEEVNDSSSHFHDIISEFSAPNNSGTPTFKKEFTNISSCCGIPDTSKSNDENSDTKSKH